MFIFCLRKFSLLIPLLTIIVVNMDSIALNFLRYCHRPVALNNEGTHPKIFIKKIQSLLF